MIKVSWGSFFYQEERRGHFDDDLLHCLSHLYQLIKDYCDDFFEELKKGNIKVEIDKCEKWRLPFLRDRLGIDIFIITVD